MLAIWMTGSLSASGKMPLRPAHSMSNERMRSGATPDQSPTASCEMRAVWLQGGSRVSSGRRRGASERGGRGTHSHSISYWQLEILSRLCCHPPALISSQFMPTICAGARLGVSSSSSS